jgi:ABC-2 type transport system permease protein
LPIYRERYRRRQSADAQRGERVDAQSASGDVTGRGWIVIAAFGLRALMKRRGFLFLLILAWIPAVVRGVQMYVVANVPQAAFLAVNAETFRDFLNQQESFVFFITVYAGSGLIADDLRSNALQLYLSRPITRTQYAAGKFVILATALGLVTWVPALLLLIVQVLFAGSPSFLRSNLYLVPAISLFSFIEIVVATFIMLALSSLSKSRWFVAVMYAGIGFFTHAVFGATRIATGGTAFSWISVFANLTQVGDVIFRLRPRFAGTHPAVSVAALAIVVAASIAVLSRRIRAVEVVA